MDGGPFPSPGNVVCGTALITSTEPGNFQDCVCADCVCADCSASCSRRLKLAALLADSVWSRMNGWLPFLAKIVRFCRPTLIQRCC